MISKQNFKTYMKKLEVAFMKKVPKETLALYYKKLCGINDKDFENIVDILIDREDFFPPIAKFFKIKHEECSRPHVLTTEQIWELNE